MSRDHRAGGEPAADHGQQWSLTTPASSTPAQAARADVAITGTTQALKAFIFAGSDAGLDIAGDAEPVQRFRLLIGTLATVVPPA